MKYEGEILLIIIPSEREHESVALTALLAKACSPTASLWCLKFSSALLQHCQQQPEAQYKFGLHWIMASMDHAIIPILGSGL